LANFTDTADYSADLENCGGSYTKYTGADHWIGDDGGTCMYRTGLKFTISTLPVTDTVTQVDFICQVTAVLNFSASSVYIGPYNGDGLGSFDTDGDNATTWGKLDVSGDYYKLSTAFRTTGSKSTNDMGAQAEADVEAARDAGTVFTIALQADTEAGVGSDRVDIDDAGGATPPELTITHSSAASAALTGTITATVDEDDITAGNKILTITLTGDTFVAAGATFDAQRQAILDGLDGV